MMRSKVRTVWRRGILGRTCRWLALGVILQGRAVVGDVSTVMFQDNMVVQQGMTVQVFGVSFDGGRGGGFVSWADEEYRCGGGWKVGGEVGSDDEWGAALR